MLAAEAAREGLDHVRFLLRLAELELIDRERRMVERRIRAARFPAVKSFDTFDFAAIPSLNKPLVLELARCEYIAARENIIALGNSGTGKTHACLALGPSSSSTPRAFCARPIRTAPGRITRSMPRARLRVATAGGSLISAYPLVSSATRNWRPRTKIQSLRRRCSTSRITTTSASNATSECRIRMRRATRCSRRATAADGTCYNRTSSPY